MLATPTRNACDLLDADHLAVKHLFVEYARFAYAPVSAPGIDERLALASKICDELTIHARLEEEIFYPALRKAIADTADLIEECKAEHQEAKELIAQIQDLDEADEAMDELVAELAWIIEHHVKEERDELFPKARASQTLDLEALAVQLQERRSTLTPNSAANK